ncbi:hypothetical protein GQX74_005730 [Glossina fuscipes]|nr:hypothetical protein GQX74_005730 [Glossina fuscipes]
MSLQFAQIKERFATIGDSLDLTFVELMGMPPVYNDRHPKPPTPQLPTPVHEEEKVVATVFAERATEEQEVTDIIVQQVVMVSNNLQVDFIEKVPTESAILPTPPPPPPFEYALDLPPEGAEVPYVKNFEKPTIPDGHFEKANDGDE